MIVRLFIDNELYGERRWESVPQVGHKLLYRHAGSDRLAEVVHVLWGGTPRTAIVDVHAKPTGSRLQG